MQKKFNLHFRQVIPENSKIVVAVSGGVDSMALAHLLLHNKVTIMIAHCNFMLRGDESDGDEKMVVQWAKKNQIPCKVRHINSKQVLGEEGGNLQDVLRQLRYEWFEELRQKYNFDYVATAHHKQDVAETILHNFLKGTGIAGLHGIRTISQKIIRPLLFADKQCLYDFADENNIPWREDSSNLKNDYTRNKIRNEILPNLDTLFPNIVHRLTDNAQRFSEIEILYKESINIHRKALLEKRNEDYYIPILKLEKQQAVLSTLLYELLSPFGFSAAQTKDIKQLAKAESGKWIESKTHLLLKDRRFLIITSKKELEIQHLPIVWKECITKTITTPFGQLQFEMVTAPEKFETDKSSVYLNIKELADVLVLRLWRQGDYFYPIGMGRKKKKVSKFIIEKKIPLHQKTKIWIMESQHRIAWIIGLRADERFKVKPGETVVKVTILSDCRNFFSNNQK